MSMYKNLMTFGCAAVLALGLAACGGNGGGDDGDAGAPTTTPPTGPTQAELDAERARADAAEQQLADMEAADNLAAAKALIAALAAPASFADPPDAATPAVVRQVRASYGKAPTVAVSNNATDSGATPPVDRTPPFSVTDDPADSISGWAGYNFGRTESDKSGSGSMVVYTDIGMSTSKPFAEVYAGDNADTDNDPLTRGGTDLTSAANLAKIAADGFAKQGLKTHGADELSFPGKFDGADGTYSCTGTCTSARDDNGKLSALGGTWTFEANSGAMAMVADPDHLHFGWWLRMDSDGDPAWVLPFAGGSMDPTRRFRYDRHPRSGDLQGRRRG